MRTSIKNIVVEKSLHQRLNPGKTGHNIAILPPLPLN
jgi:hypothetical protein